MRLGRKLWKLVADRSLKVYRRFDKATLRKRHIALKIDKQRLVAERAALGAVDLAALEAEFRVSVIVPTWQRAGTIGRCIGSILAQSFSNFEVIVVDDGSTDGTAEVVASFGDPRIRYEWDVNRGVSAARNRGLRLATGDVVAFLDSDNAWGPDFLRLSLASLSRSGAEATYSVLRMHDKAGKDLGYRASDFNYIGLLERNFIDLNVFVHRARAMPPDRFDERLKRAVDWDYIIRTVRGHSCAFAYFCESDYLADETVGDRLTVSSQTLFTKLVRAKNEFYFHSEHKFREIVRLARLSVAIHIAAPLAERAQWGDYYYARSIQKYLILLGYDATIHYGDSKRETIARADIYLALRGRRRFEPLTSKLNLMWVISHPETVSAEEAAGFHHVFVASSFFADYLRVEGAPSVSVLEQASDPDIFFARSDRPRDIRCLFIGSTRGVSRRFVTDIVANCEGSYIVGQGWEGIVPPEKILAEWVDYYQLPELYARARFVISEHWRSMRLFGFVANRVSDAIGAGAVIVGDRVVGDERLLGDRYASFDDAASAVAFIERRSGEEAAPTLGAPPGFVSFAEQVAAIHERVLALISNAPERDPERAGRLTVRRGADWAAAEWTLVNEILGRAPEGAWADVEVVHETDDGAATTDLVFRPPEAGLPVTTWEGLADRFAERDGRPPLPDERIWRFFGVGKMKARSPGILTVLTDRPQLDPDSLPEWTRGFEQVRIWDARLTVRRAYRVKGRHWKEGRFTEGTRMRIRRFLNDAESVVCLVLADDPALAGEMAGMGLAAGAHVIVPASVRDSLAARGIGHALAWVHPAEAMDAAAAAALEPFPLADLWEGPEG